MPWVGVEEIAAVEVVVVVAAAAIAAEAAAIVATVNANPTATDAARSVNARTPTGRRSRKFS